MSSAKRFTFSGLSSPGIEKPLMLTSTLIMHARGSIARSKIGQDKGSPCLIPLWTWNGSLNTPFMATLVDTFAYGAFIVLTKVVGRLKALRVFHRYSCLILSYTFSWSSAIMVPSSSVTSA